MNDSSSKNFPRRYPAGQGTRPAPLSFRVSQVICTYSADEKPRGGEGPSDLAAACLTGTAVYPSLSLRFENIVRALALGDTRPSVRGLESTLGQARHDGALVLGPVVAV